MTLTYSTITLTIDPNQFDHQLLQFQSAYPTLDSSGFVKNKCLALTHQAILNSQQSSSSAPHRSNRQIE
uniref:Uncharacterized protein n=1 Tax=Vespula pensylvanica TaxID=30213 RepID=A0A834MWA3_VESPE|nr:hypothetical protein H0235_018367 [Vespula pensylvanica]